MKGTIDRFEGDYAVVEFERRKMITLAKELLPPNAKEGDVIELQNGKYVVNSDETIKRVQEIEQLSDGLWDK